MCICERYRNLWFSCNSLIVKKNTQRTAVRKTKFSIAFIGETRKKERFSIKYAVNKAFITWQIPVSCENRQTENLGDFGRFQPSGMRTFQILRFSEKVIIPCNSPSKQGKRKAEWRVTIRHQGKKMVEDIYANQNLFSIFVTLWLPNIRTGTREFGSKIVFWNKQKWSPFVRKQYKGHQKRAAINNSIDCKGFPEDWEEQRKMFGVK